jgi:hypothetical protein
MKNILNLEIDELAVNAVKGVNIFLKTLNSLSPRSFSFINPALLGFSSRNVKILQGSS